MLRCPLLCMWIRALIMETCPLLCAAIRRSARLGCVSRTQHPVGGMGKGWQHIDSIAVSVFFLFHLTLTNTIRNISKITLIVRRAGLSRLPMITNGLPFTADSNDVSIISPSKATSLCKRCAREPKKLVPEKPKKWERCSTSSVEGDQKDQQDQPKHCKHWENQIWRSRDKMRTVIVLRGWES